MASTYSPNLRLELIGTGEQQGTWGATTNTNLGTLLEEAIGGYTSVTVSNVTDTTLTTNNGSADQSRNMVINLTGALTGTRNVICPAIEKLYVVKNATTGSQSVVFKVSGQTGVTIPNGVIEFIYVDGTDARSITGSIASQDANSVAITGGTISGVTVSNTSLSNVAVVANASSLGVRDSDGSHVLSIAAGSNLTANRVLTLTTGDAARTFDISAGNVTISTAGAALIDDADASAQRTTLGLGTIATQNSNNVSITGGSASGVSLSNVAVVANASSLSVRDADGSNILSIAVGSNLTVNRVLTLTTGDAARTLDISSGNVTISTAGAALIDDADASAQRTTLGLGTIATQNSNAVSITGGSIVANASSLGVRDSDGSNVMSIAVGSNLTANRVFTLTTGDAARTLDISAGNVTISTAGASLIDDADASAQRTTLGLGTIATQNANNVSITGGSISGITDLALADGGTGASLADPNANAILGWNDTAGVMRFFTAGTGITINATANTISATGGPPTTNTQTFNSSGTWTKPSGDYTSYSVQLWGGGGSGGRGGVGGEPGGGGGGGGYWEFTGAISELGGTETVTVGAGGAAISGFASGNPGGPTSFTRANSTTITVYGGGGGGQPTGASGAGGGGGGGSIAGVGAVGSNATGGAGGGSDAGSGGGTSTTGGKGITGGGGGGGTATDAVGANGAGGSSVFGGGGGGAGAEDSSPGPGAGGTSVYGGNGGAGAFDASNGTAGSQPGGGGGGAETGTSGKGGDGRIIVTVW